MSTPTEGPFETREERQSAIAAAFAAVEAKLIVSSFEARGYGHEDDDAVAGGAS